MICRTMSSVQNERKPSTEVARRSDGRLDLWLFVLRVCAPARRKGGRERYEQRHETSA